MSFSPRVNAKSLLAAASAGVTAWLAARSGGLTSNEVWGIVLAVVAPLGIVWAVPNADPEPKRPAGEHVAES